MYRNKKTGALLLAFALLLSLSGCGAAGSLVTDTGSGKQQQIAKENYLKTDVLENQREQTAEDLYKVLTLEKGTFEEAALNQILKRSYLNVPTVRFSLEGITSYFGEYLVEFWDYVEAGDVIATVHTEVDEIAVEEAGIRLQRLQERYQKAEARASEELQELAEEGAASDTSYEKQMIELRYRQKTLDWEYSKYNYESQIQDAARELDKLTKAGEIYEVKADTAGYVAYSTKYTSGTELHEGDYICHIMNSSQVYAVTDSQADQFYYGMEVTFDNRNGLTPAVVVNGGSWMLYGNLDKAQAVFRLDFEQEVSELDETGLNNLVLKGNLKTVENVILVPKAAVTVEDEEYFVTVLKEDGTLLKTEFIPGGSNVESYWVLEGLTEGMQIVYN